MSDAPHAGAFRMKVMVIGLDSAAPDLVFERWWAALPNLRALTAGGIHGDLLSTHPPITVPAWSSMTSGRDPGQLGFYGFRNRRDYSYGRYYVANATAVRVDRVWDTLSARGKQVILLGVPQTYPVRPVNGCVVGDFLAPSTDCEYTWPPTLRDEIARVADGYVLDVDNFRTPDKADLLERIYRKTHKHFAVAKHLATTRPWDFFMMVEMGVDRIQHGFWSYCDPAHRKYRAGNPFEDALRDYYRYVDREVGELVSLADRDTAVLVVSDHGARRMEGGLCLNEWLVRQGYLALSRAPATPARLDDVAIDWDRTVAWGEGGYHGRVFLNVRGREPRGVVARSDYDRVVEDLAARLAAIEDPDGRVIGTRALRPEEMYPNGAKGIPSDLTVYFGDLAWRSVGAVGLGSIWSFDNDTGPDEANHDWRGIYLANARAAGRLGLTPGRGGPFAIADVARQVLELSEAVPAAPAEAGPERMTP
jgi:predicted AlkP superfamily phosphohydrolase/phosphomutase